MRLPWEQLAAYHARLAARAAGGDQRAFVALYRDLYPTLARFVARRAACPSDAEEVVARAFHRLLEALPRLDPARGTVLGFTLAIARNALADEARARRAGGREPLGPEALERSDGRPGADDRLLERERLLAVARLLDGLPAETRELLELRFGDGLRHAEIAALTGASEAAVKQRVSRAVRELRAALAAPEAGPRELTS